MLLLKFFSSFILILSINFGYSVLLLTLTEMATDVISALHWYILYQSYQNGVLPLC